MFLIPFLSNELGWPLTMVIIVVIAGLIAFRVWRSRANRRTRQALTRRDSGPDSGAPENRPGGWR